MGQMRRACLLHQKRNFLKVLLAMLNDEGRALLAQEPS